MDTFIKKIKRSIKPYFRYLPPIRGITQDMKKTPLWGIDEIRTEDQTLEIKGWALPPEEGPQAAGFTLDGVPFEQIDYPLEREDIQRIFWWAPRSRFSGFHCRTPFSPAQATAGTAITLAYAAKSTGLPFSERHNHYYCGPAGPPLPPPEKRRRVQGTANEYFFLLEGCSIYVKLERALKSYVKKGYSDFSRVLDWGCGCGRLSRYFAERPNPCLTGVDIDEDNVGWCRENLGFADFQAIPLDPPTPLADGHFDLLIGISVLTHLGEGAQREWLRELHRLAAPNAVLLLSVHGMTSFMRARMSGNFIFSMARLLRFMCSRGFYDIGTSSDLGDSIGDATYYRSVFHSRKYIGKYWREFFDVVQIIPGYIGNNQDLAILRKRADRRPSN
jgi:SAM-dependent methyltransferase